MEFLKNRIKKNRIKTNRIKKNVCSQRESNPEVQTEPRKKNRTLHLGYLDHYALMEKLFFSIF